MILTINLNINEFPIISKFKDDEQTEILLKLVRTGYQIHFPYNNTIIHNTEYNEIIHKIDIIKNELKNEINNSETVEKISSLENSLNKLIGISSNSYKKGYLGECLLEEIIRDRYSDIEFEKKGNIPHSGDAWLHLPNNKIVMLESKNYTTVINKDEIIKLQNDMINHHIKWGIMISFNSLIQGMKELDFHTFIHNQETYFIIMISNLGFDIHKLDLGIQIIKKLITNFDNNIEFPWIVKNISQSLYELNNIIQKNYFLRDTYYNMEKDIQKLLSNYYSILREYQYDIEKKINEIINTIQGTMNKSIELNDNYNSLLNNYHDKKIYPLITRTIDFINNKKWKINIDSVNNDYTIINDENIEMGKIKIQIKKVIINIFKFDILINLNLGKDKENKQILDIIKMIT